MFFCDDITILSAINQVMGFGYDEYHSTKLIKEMIKEMIKGESEKDD